MLFLLGLKKKYLNINFKTLYESRMLVKNISTQTVLKKKILVQWLVADNRADTHKIYECTIQKSQHYDIHVLRRPSLHFSRWRKVHPNPSYQPDAASANAAV